MMGEKITTVEELADRVARQDAAATGVAAAQQRAAELVERARAEGRRLVAQARAVVDTADEDYAAAYQAAAGAGWTHAELQQMSYPAPARRRRAGDAERTRPAAGTSTARPPEAPEPRGVHRSAPAAAAADPARLVQRPAGPS
jgi:hypothetical protein